MDKASLEDYQRMMQTASALDEAMKRQIAAFYGVKDAINSANSAMGEMIIGSVSAADAGKHLTSILQSAGDGFFKAGQTGTGFAGITGALQGGLVGLASAAAGVVLTGIINFFTEVAEKEKNLKTATQDLGPLLRGAGEGFTAAGVSASGAISNMRDFRENVDSMIESHAALVEETGKKFNAIEVDVAVAEQYRQTIHELANTANLGAEGQVRLQAAVAGLNEITGSTIEITDLANGKLSESVDSIDQSTEAWKRNAMAQASQELLVEYTRDQIKNDIALKQAKKELLDVQTEMLEQNPEMTEADVQRSYAYQQAQGEVERLTELGVDYQGQIDTLTETMAENTTVMTSSVEGITSYISSNEAFTAALSSSGVEAGGFAEALSALGITTGELDSIGSENMEAFVASFSGGADALLEKSVELGIAMPGQFQHIADTLGKDVALGYLDGLDPDAANAVMEEMGVSSLEALRETLEVSSPSKAAQEIGMNTALGFSTGLSEDESSIEAALGMGDKALLAIGESVTPESAAVIAANAALGFSGGLAADQTSLEAALAMGTNSLGALASGVTPESAAAIAANTALGFSGGLSADQSAIAAALGLGGTTLGALGTGATPESAAAIARSAALGFSGGLGADIENARTKAADVAGKAKEGFEVENGNALTWGEHLVTQMAGGIDAKSYLTKNAAGRVAEGIKRLLHFTRPDEGPLREYETWMPHMISGLTTTMQKASYSLFGEAKALAQGISENINDWELTDSSLDKFTLPHYGQSNSAKAADADANATNNYYTIGDVSYTPDTRIAELMDKLFIELNRVKRMGVA